MSFWTAVKIYPKAMAWSIAITMSIVMDGYDASVMGSCESKSQWGHHHADCSQRIPCFPAELWSTCRQRDKADPSKLAERYLWGQQCWRHLRFAVCRFLQ